jgi:hypothetical protein
VAGVGVAVGAAVVARHGHSTPQDACDFHPPLRRTGHPQGSHAAGAGEGRLGRVHMGGKQTGEREAWLDNPQGQARKGVPAVIKRPSVCVCRVPCAVCRVPCKSTRKQASTPSHVILSQGKGTRTDKMGNVRWQGTSRKDPSGTALDTSGSHSPGDAHRPERKSTAVRSLPTTHTTYNASRDEREWGSQRGATAAVYNQSQCSHLSPRGTVGTPRRDTPLCTRAAHRTCPSCT